MIECWLDTASPYEIEASDAAGFTTNPVLRRGWTGETIDYPEWEERVLAAADGRPISLEVQGPDNWRAQAQRILELGPNVFVKIPIQSPTGESSAALIADLERVNATCCFTVEHVWAAYKAKAAIASIFAGRIADTGHEPWLLFGSLTKNPPGVSTRLLWASAREVLNVKQAEQAGADIITLSPDLYAKRALLGKDLDQHALDTVREFCQ